MPFLANFLTLLKKMAHYGVGYVCKVLVGVSYINRTLSGSSTNGVIQVQVLLTSVEEDKVMIAP